jgi:hypothetical protein
VALAVLALGSGARWFDGGRREVLYWLGLGQLFHFRAPLANERGDSGNAKRPLFRALNLCQEVHHAQGVAEGSDSLANLLLRRGMARAALRFVASGEAVVGFVYSHPQQSFTAIGVCSVAPNNACSATQLLAFGGGTGVAGHRRRGITGHLTAIIQ